MRNQAAGMVHWKLRVALSVLFSGVFSGLSTRAFAAESIVSRTADVEGVKLHYPCPGTAPRYSCCMDTLKPR